jgi:hypothetical protein
MKLAPLPAVKDLLETRWGVAATGIVVETALICVNYRGFNVWTAAVVCTRSVAG